MEGAVSDGPLDGHNAMGPLNAPGSGTTNINHNHVEQYYYRPQSDRAGNYVGMVQADGQSRVHIGHNIQNIQGESDTDECLRSLYVTDPARDRDGIITKRGRRMDGTCNWIESTMEYRKWNESKAGLLWICGGPGKGKTFIAIYLSERLETLAQKQTGTIALYFFCDNKDSTRSSATNMLRGLIFQLISHKSYLVQILLSRWRFQGETLFRQQSFETLWRIFLLMLEEIQYHTVQCIIDGLDECDIDSQRTILLKVNELFGDQACQGSNSKLKLIILSREHPSLLQEYLSPFPHIRLDHALELKEDVEAYISKKAYELVRMKNIVDTPLHQQINDIFKERSEKSFLWVSFVSQDLESKDIIQLERSLTQLPQGLKEIYKRIISCMDENDKMVLREIFIWVTLVDTPLSVNELCEALKMKGTDLLTREQVCLSHIKSCAHLLQISTHSEREVVTLVHQSAKDFLLDAGCAGLFAVDHKEGHEHITNRMLECVIDTLESQYYRDDLIKKPSFFSHAFNNWPLHFNALQNDFDGITTKHKSLFRRRDSRIRHLVCSPTDIYAYLSPRYTLLLMACHKGLFYLANRLVNSIWYKLGFRKNPISGKWYQAVRFLLSHLFRHSTTIVLHGRSLRRYTPLTAACKGGHYEIVKLLIKSGINATTSWYAADDLLWALRADQSDIFLCLMETDEAKELIHGENAARYLVEAAANGKGDCCRLLIEQYNVPVDRKAYGNVPLVAALRRGHFDLVRKFVREWHAQVEPDRTYLDAIFSQSSKSEFLQALDLVFRELECDINATHMLCQAIFWDDTKKWEDEESISALISFGADPGLQHTDGNTPLHCAIENDAFEMVIRPERFGFKSFSYPSLKILIKIGKVDINSRNSFGRTPLHVLVQAMIDHDRAAYRFEDYVPDTNELSIIQPCRWLLDLGANRYMRDNEGNTPIDYTEGARGGAKLFAHNLKTYTTVPLDYSDALCAV